MKNEPFSIARDEAARLGLSLTVVRQKKHMILKLANVGGNSRLMVIPASPSDPLRGRRNVRATLRRLARNLEGAA